MFTSYDGQKFTTVEECEKHNVEVREKLVKEQREKEVKEKEKATALEEINDLAKKLGEATADYEKKYGDIKRSEPGNVSPTYHRGDEFVDLVSALNTLLEW